MLSVSHLSIANQIVLVLRWKKAFDMNKLLNPISDRIDGTLKYQRHGHNFPFLSLAPNERKAFLRFSNKQWSYCIAVTNQTAKTSLQHEICHARFFLDTEYRQQRIQEWNALSNKHVVIRVLKALGYKESVWIDEWQAYSLSGDSFLFDK